MTARPPSPRSVTGWILRRPETLTESEQLQLKTIRVEISRARRAHSPCPVLRNHADRAPGRTTPGLAFAVRRDGLSSLHTLAAGSDRDRDAVTAGLTLPWSSGVIEGTVK